MFRNQLYPVQFVSKPTLSSFICFETNIKKVSDVSKPQKSVSFESLIYIYKYVLYVL